MKPNGIISFNTEDESKAFIKGMEHMATIYEMERNNYDIDISEEKAKKVVQGALLLNSEAMKLYVEQCS